MTQTHTTNISKVVFFTSILFALSYFSPSSAYAQLTKEVNKNIGIGVMLGEPTGVTVKIWKGDKTAFDIGGAWSIAKENEALHLHASLLRHSWFQDRPNIAFYYGIGGRILFIDDAAIGVRVPFGLTYVANKLPLDFFVEVAPIFDLVPDSGFAGNGAIGMRIYF